MERDGKGVVERRKQEGMEREGWEGEREGKGVVE